MSMSLLSALLPLTLVLNSSHPSFYHHPLLLTSSAILTAITRPGTLTPQKINQAKICLTGSFLIFYLLTTPNITPYYTAPLETAPSLISGSCPHSLQMQMANPSRPRLKSSSYLYSYFPYN